MLRSIQGFKTPNEQLRGTTNCTASSSVDSPVYYVPADSCVTPSVLMLSGQLQAQFDPAYFMIDGSSKSTALALISNVTSAISVTPMSIVNELSKFYCMRNPYEIKAFLERHPDATALLYEAESVLGMFFPECRFALKYTIDPEYPEDEILTLRIVTKMSPRDAVNQLRRFRDKWWTEARKEASVSTLALGLEPA